MIPIRLRDKSWQYESSAPLGKPGGFGQVFRGVGEDGVPVAVKRLHVTAEQAAHRELNIAQDLARRHFYHVLPVLDSGQDAESDAYFVVMPIAERSLGEYLSGQGRLSEGETRDILRQILWGLAEAAHIVHRDLKPDNILRHDGKWKIADFGIARFLEDSTSTETLKNCLSPHFAAPEQWLNEHATSATDIYAVGCIAHALLTGAPPFTGSVADLQRAHISASPPEIASALPQLRAVVSMMLRKSPAARPSRDRVIQALESMHAATTAPCDEALDRLASAAAAHEQKLGAAEAERQKDAALARQRTALAGEAHQILRAIFEALAKRILDAVPTAVVQTQGPSWTIQVGTAALTMQPTKNVFAGDAFPLSKWDVVANAAIDVRQSHPEHIRSASLWYTRQSHPHADFRWYEVGYTSNPFSGKGFKYEPTAVDAATADRAHAPGMDVVQTAYPPTPIDDEDTDRFCRRWAHVLAEACSGRLRYLPSGLPHVSTA